MSDDIFDIFDNIIEDTPNQCCQNPDYKEMMFDYSQVPVKICTNCGQVLDICFVTEQTDMIEMPARLPMTKFTKEIYMKMKEELATKSVIPVRPPITKFTKEINTKIKEELAIKNTFNLDEIKYKLLDDYECPVCLRIHPKGVIVYELHCKHKLCQECTKQMVKHWMITCPLCRKDFFNVVA